MIQLFKVAIASIFALHYAVVSTAPEDALVVFTRGEGGYYCHKIPYLLRTFSGILIALAEGRGSDGREACDDFSGTDLVYKRSMDQGKTWSDLQVLYSNSTTEETNVIGNAAPVQDRNTNRIWMPFCRNNEEMFMMYSDNDGETWSDATYMPQLVHSDWKWVGVGPPGGLQLTSGRLLVPGYHSTLFKGDGWVTYGHTVYSDDGGETWEIGSAEFGVPYLSNECQAVQLSNSSVLINARTLTNRRIQVLSHDGGLTFDEPTVMADLTEPLEGCEGSLVRAPISNVLYFSDPNNPSLVRHNMTVFQSLDDGASWQVLHMVDGGAVAYSSLQVIPSNQQEEADGFEQEGLELLYERSNEANLVFEPDEIVYWRVPV